ncbi:hypothetical protein B0A48_13296 [Cryoendolithus antarcticus]|uniref:Uncharacterized protein n=1 Tax=Cryoendolithus antarcticus TaxID=1507870 RepID=A0A1V8SPI6_9PEZI|nr:hypothetical protein B0A48_13296 [Cryoendolithus antarcticus]
MSQISSFTAPKTSQQCYFSISPATYSNYASKTPLQSPSGTFEGQPPSEPSNPLLAYRHTPGRIMAATNLLQLQTAAAHNYPATSRPRPIPQQNVPQTTSSNSSDSGSSSSNSPSASSHDLSHLDARCSRCQRSQSTDLKTGRTNMVQFGLNT